MLTYALKNYKIITDVINGICFQIQAVVTKERMNGMSRKESISKEAIVQAAFEILQEEGIEQVTARKLAVKAGCSTQPIFRVYKGMEELIEELFGKACSFFQDFYAGMPRQTVTPFVNLGLAYIKFAQEHKKLFEFIFLSENRFGRSLYDLVNGNGGYVSKEIQTAAAQGCSHASDLFMKMWIFIHGAACMSLTGDYDLSETETMQLLKDSYQAFR